MKKLFLILFCFIATVSMAQNRSYKLRGDKAYAEKDYVTAAYYYDKALENGTTTTQGTVPYFSTRQNKDHKSAEVGYITYHLAESYRLYHNLIEAEGWYRQLVEDYEVQYPLSRLWYAVCLRSNDHINESISQLQVFVKANKDNKQNSELGDKELNNSLFAKEQMGATSLSKATKFANNLNADAGDFAMSIQNLCQVLIASFCGDSIESVLKLFTISQCFA